MSLKRILHTTIYHYREPVEFGVHRLVIRPREGHDLQVIRLKLDIQPASTVSWHRDIFGNSIAVVRFSEKSKCLEIRSDVTIAWGDASLMIHGLIELSPMAYPVVYSALESPLIQGYLTPVYPGEAEGLGEWLRAVFDARAGCNAVELVREIGNWIHETIQYRRREDRGVQTPLETLRLQTGSCRDMATLLLEAVRALQLPSRFASGYLDSRSAAAGLAATHAWTEIYFPEQGWHGYDPTLGESTSHKHIAAGVSSHPRGIMPVSGTYSGPAEFYKGMEVHVRIEPTQPHPAEREPSLLA